MWPRGAYMKSLLHNRVELVELYFEARTALDDAGRDALVEALVAAGAAAARKRFGAVVELLINIERGSGKGAAAACRMTIATAKPSTWFKPGGSLESIATDLDRRGTMFVRDMLAAASTSFGGSRRAIGRKEHRRKAPGKILELLRRMKPAGVLNVASLADLAAGERAWLTEHIGALMRTVHSPAVFKRLMQRLKRETAVGFVPSDPAEIENLASKLIGVSERERLHRRRTRPMFAAGGLKTVAVKIEIGASALPGWFSS